MIMAAGNFRVREQSEYLILGSSLHPKWLKRDQSGEMLQIDKSMVLTNFFHIKLFALIILLSLCFQPSCGQAHQIRYNVLEEQPAPYFIGDLSRDFDHQGPFISAIDVEGIIVHLSGVINTTQPLDRETKSEELSLIVTTFSPPSLTVTVIVSLIDVNDHAPTFPEDSIHLELSESTIVGSRRTLSSALDPDLDLNGIQGYAILSGNTFNTFSIETIPNPQDNQILQLDLVIEKDLDRENISTFNLVIEAFDGAQPPKKGVLNVDISILDINDNSPAFPQSSYEISVKETLAVNSLILQLNATDPDAGPNGEVVYAIAPYTNLNEYFRIDSRTGEIFINKPLDYEVTQEHNLIILANDNATQPQTSTALVTITVSNENEEPPTINILFLSDDTTPKVSEAAEIGDYVARISVNDPDEGQLTNANVTITGGNGRFGLDTKDQLIYLVCIARPLDRELIPSYDLTIHAHDFGDPPLVAEKSFTLVVEDINDNPPVFEYQKYTPSVVEVADPGVHVETVHATDRDIGLNREIRYSIANVNDPYVDWFRIDPTSGIITTETEIDREASSNVTLRITATDMGEPPLSANVIVDVHIQDVNDNQPQFTTSSYNSSISEDVPTNTCFLQVHADDPDTNSYGEVTYSIGFGTSVPAPSEFRIDSNTGYICTVQPLDRDYGMKEYVFPVQATDGGRLSSIALVKVHVEDVNDNRPVFYPETYAVDIDDSSRPGKVVTSVVAEDADSENFGTVTYAIISGNVRNTFRIDESTGDIILQGTLNRDQVDVYSLEVAANDGGGLKSLQNAFVTISIVGPDNSPPFFSKTRYSFTVDENVDRYTSVGIVIASSAVPDDQSQVRFTIHSGDPNGYFSIHPTNGALTVDSSPDHEADPYVLLNIQASSGNPPSYANAQVNVTIRDLNDNAPKFPSSAQITSIPESTVSGTTIFVASASDPDSGSNGDVRYRLVENSDNIFTINSISGQVELLEGVSYNVKSRYELVVQAYDLGASPLTTNLTLIVQILDVNDNGPTFNHSSYEEWVSESTKVGRGILQVSATDRDTGSNARITFSLAPSNAASNFGIFPDTGWIYLKHQLDYERRTQYVIEVVATDNGTPAQSTTAGAILNVVDDNDNEPVFDKEIYSFTVEENVAHNTEVGVVMARDRDSWENGRVTYSMLSAGPFAVGETTGYITTTGPIDYEEKAGYKITITATDHGIPVLTTTADVYINLIDLNDNGPIFSHQDRYTASVREGESVGAFVIRILAKDADSGSLGNVTYSFSPDVGDFDINPTTGIVRIATLLDRETKDMYTVNVVASDDAFVSRQQEIPLFIKILDDNDNAPSVVNANLTFTVREDLPPHSKIGTIVAFDADLGQNSRLFFSIIDGNSFGMFIIDHVTGVLNNTKEVDYELFPHYRLKILVEDNGSIRPQNVTIFVDINVLDVNDNSPVFEMDPVFLAIMENCPVSETLWTFVATDADSGQNGDVRYSLLLEPEQVYVAIDSITGILRTIALIDREMTSEIHVVVKAEDQAVVEAERRSSSVSVIIVVGDENDNSPVFLSRSITSVMEDEPIGYPVLHIVATDADARYNGQITYQISHGNEDGKFALNPATGVLNVSHSLNYEHRTEYALEILAIDRGIEPRSTAQTIRIFVEDVNDLPPVFEQTLYVFNISEEGVVGDIVGQVLATDGDSGRNGNLTYEIPAGITDGKFSIDANTGLMRSLARLDREDIDSYSFPVYVMDGAFPALYDVTTVTVNLEDIHDNAPVFASSLISLSVPEGQEPSVIHTVVAFDADSSTGSLLYYIQDGNLDGLFVLDSQTGQLSTTSRLDRETKSEFDLTITVVDDGNPPMMTNAVIRINVSDLNDNNPTFASSSFGISVAENTPNGSNLLTVFATDPDDGLNGEIFYSLDNSTQGLFEIDELTGQISTIGSFDFEKQSSHTFQVKATDRGFSPRTEKVQVTVTITDVNDNAPVFTVSPIRANVSEGTTSGTLVSRLTAEDKDSGMNGQVAYRFVNPASVIHFLIQGDIILTKTTLGSRNMYRHEVEAYNPNVIPQLPTRAMVEIWVGSTSRATIVFSQETYLASLSEDAAKNLNFLTMTVKGQRDDLQFSIASGNENGAFRLEQTGSTASLLVEDSSFLDYETNPDLQLIIEVEAPSGGVVPDYGYTTVNIELTDANDNTPQFTQNSFSIAIEERNETGFFVFQVMASDIDEGANADVRYYITNGNHNNAFSIGPITGIIENTAILDRETKASYRLLVNAVDDGIPRRIGEATLKITITDRNDNKPVFPLYQPIEINEGLEVGSVVTKVKAEDPDEDPSITYSTNGGNPGHMFNIDPYSGTISLAEPLDRESQDSYELTVKAMDGRHLTETTIFIRVLDENDNAPVFTQQSYQVTLPELTPPHHLVTQVNATDADSDENGRITYSMTVAPIQGFYINSETGEIRTNQTIQYNEAQPVIQLVVMATDQGETPLSHVVAVRIQVTDVNNNGPTFTRAVYSASVAEDAERGSRVVVVTATDDDPSYLNQKIDFYIVDGNVDNTFFILSDEVSSTVEITVFSSLDRETRDVYNLIILAQDRGTPQRNSTAEVVIQVTDINDNAPVFSPAEYEGSVKENANSSTQVIQVKAFDVDEGNNGRIRYEIRSGDDHDMFVIDPNTGWIMTKGRLDHEEVSFVRLVVRASDSWSENPLHSTVNVLINITDENDNSPYFSYMVYLERVPENEPPRKIFQVQAHDKDTGIYGKLNYSIIGGDGKDFFEIDSSTGYVSSTSSFDYEETESFGLIIRATDYGGQTASVQAQVNVTGVDEYAPVFIGNPYFFNISQDARKGDLVGTVTASDEDAGPDKIVLYQFSATTADFEINEQSGEIRVNRTLKDSNKVKRSLRSRRASEVQFSLLIKASSGRPNSLETFTTGVVNVGSGTAVGLPRTDDRASPILFIIIACVAIIVAFVLACIIFVAVIRRRRKEDEKTQPDGASLNRSVSPRSYDPTFDHHVEMGPGILNPNITENHLLNMSYQQRNLYGMPGTNSSMEVGHLTNKDFSEQSHSASSGRGSTTVEDEEIRQINEQTSGPRQTREKVIDSGIQEDGSYRNSLSSLNSPRTKPFSTSVESMHIFVEEGGGESGGHYISAQLEEGMGGEAVALMDGHQVFGFNEDGHPSMGGSLSSIVNSEEELSGSYNWDYLLDWGPQFQPLAHVFAEIAKLKDDSVIHQPKAFQPINKTHPPPLITNIIHGPIKQLDSRKNTSHSNSLINQSRISNNLPHSPITYDSAFVPSAVTPDLSPSLSPLAPGSLSPLVTSTGVSSSQSSRRNSGSKSSYGVSPRSARGGIKVNMPAHLTQEPEIHI